MPCSNNIITLDKVDKDKENLDIEIENCLTLNNKILEILENFKREKNSYMTVEKVKLMKRKLSNLTTKFTNLDTTGSQSNSKKRKLENQIRRD